jgi:hypothetical protein
MEHEAEVRCRLQRHLSGKNDVCSAQKYNCFYIQPVKGMNLSCSLRESKEDRKLVRRKKEGRYVGKKEEKCKSLGSLHHSEI